MARWADLLVDYCLRVAPGKTIAIAAELEGRPLVEACYRAVVLRGAHPLIRVDLPGLSEFFLQHATDDQLSHLPPVGCTRPRRSMRGSGSRPRPTSAR